MNRPSLLIIFLTVFIDLIGFGIVLPLLSIYAELFGGSYLLVGVIAASYSMMQFVFAPAWGRLSDKIGRRPVILISLAGASGSYALFAIASRFPGETGLLVLLLSRIFAGICGANLSVASAYIADITPPEQRSKRMGLIGMAFGLGFICGPIIGAVTSAKWGLEAPGWAAAAVCGLNFILAIFILKESRKPGSHHAPHMPKWKQISKTLKHPKIGFLIGIFFLATFCFTCFEVTFPMRMKSGLQFSASTVGYLFAYCGVIAAVIQGGLIGRLVKKYGEEKLIVISLFILSGGLVMLPYQTSLGWVMVGLGVFAVGSGLNRPPTFGLISQNASDDEQGATMGVAQSAGSLARMIGPIVASVLYGINHTLPYLVCGGTAFLTAILAWFLLCRGKGGPTRTLEPMTADEAEAVAHSPILEDDDPD
ncbi:MAG: DHA1 family tetracycline resistance protein-like MFS transporter [Candidatus Binatia bacterium]|jgi:multidrug resistance protein